MLHTASRLELNGDITSAQAAFIHQANDEGTFDHTIGYELEILKSAKKDIPAYGLDDSAVQNVVTASIARRFHEYGYGTGTDGLIEIQSPAAQHPLALTIATNGVIEAGILPRKARGVVTSHVSIGFNEKLYDQKLWLFEGNTFHSLVRILRMTEQLETTTPGRLMAPIHKAESEGAETGALEFSWNCKGSLGVNIQRYEYIRPKDTKWDGRNNRVEFRTLRYVSAPQHSIALNALYYFTRGLFSPIGSVPYSLVEEHEDWFRDYAKSNKLPDAELISKEHGYPLETFVGLKDYIAPYAAHLAESNKNEIQIKTSRVIKSLQEAFGFAKLHDQFATL